MVPCEPDSRSDIMAHISFALWVRIEFLLLFEEGEAIWSEENRKDMMLSQNSYGQQVQQFQKQIEQLKREVRMQRQRVSSSSRE